MKEEILNKFVDKLLVYAQNTESFLVEQTPEYIKQLLEFAMFDAAINIIMFSLVFLVLSIVFIWSSIKVIKSDNDNMIGVMIISGIFFFVSAIPFFVEVPNAIKTIYKIKYTPKVYIVEQITNMRSYK